MKKYKAIGMLAILMFGFFMFTGGINENIEEKNYTAPVLETPSFNAVKVTSTNPADYTASIYTNASFSIVAKVLSDYKENSCKSRVYESYEDLEGTLVISKNGVSVDSVKVKSSKGSSDKEGVFNVALSFNRAGTYTATWYIHSKFTELTSTKTFQFTVNDGPYTELANAVYALTSFSGKCVSTGKTLTATGILYLKDSKVTILSESSLKFHVSIDFGLLYSSTLYPCLQKTYSYDLDGTYLVGTTGSAQTLTINYNNDKNVAVRAVFGLTISGNVVTLTIKDDSNNEFTYTFTKQ